jgi:eukaryotic-like serine/threonine-protein kinase
MTPARLQQIEDLFHAARGQPPAEREAFLIRECAGDSALRREVESLLGQPSAGVIDAPLGGLAADLVSTAGPRLARGTSIGPYRIESLLDVGGMGEVYRARDTALGRDVAIKILPQQFTADVERLARFEREARLLASLNHPHIAAIYGVVEANSVRGLVLEFVEGRTLSAQMIAGALPVDQALRIAHQIAEALDAAHDKGVIHRDLKPANIKLTPEGRVKVLDFGLAKAVGAADADADSDSSPTTIAHRTKVGLVLGTATYMSPEQARGRPVDKRTDIWAFGCVLYEMLTGINTFDAKTAAEAAAKILEREPDWTLLPPRVPQAIRRLLQRCLNKDPAERLHDIADARLEIADALSGPASPATPERVIATAPRWRSTAAAAIAGAIVGALAIALVLAGRPATAPPLLEFPINLTDTTGLGVAVSPNGRQVAFSTFTNGAPQLWIHALDTGITRVLPGGAGGYLPFWSPDSRAVAFFALDLTLKRMDVADGTATVICKVGTPYGGTWNGDGTIVFSSEANLLRVSAAGGAAVPIDLVDDADGPTLRTYPQFLSDGRHFIYHASGRRGDVVRVASLDARETNRIVESDYAAAFAAPSHLLFLRGTTLMAQTFNLRTLALEGRPSVVAADAAPGWMFGPLGRLSQFAASPGGVLAVMKTRGGADAQLAWFDRRGAPAGSIEQPPGSEYMNPAISPDGTRVAVSRMDPITANWDVWVLDVARHVASRLTSGPEPDSDPVWSADGKQIVFASLRNGRFGLYRKPADGSQPEEILANMGDGLMWLAPTDWSPDGRFVLYRTGAVVTSREETTLWALPLTGDRRPIPAIPGSFQPYGGRFARRKVDCLFLGRNGCVRSLRATVPRAGQQDADLAWRRCAPALDVGRTRTGLLGGAWRRVARRHRYIGARASCRRAAGDRPESNPDVCRWTAALRRHA